MFWYEILLVIFVCGYILITLEHSINVEKASIAIFAGLMMWSILALTGSDYVGSTEGYQNYIAKFPAGSIKEYIVSYSLNHYLVDIANIVFFLVGALTIVEILDRNHAFFLLIQRIYIRNMVPLMWVVGGITFFLSSVLDNLTATVVMASILRVMIKDDKYNKRWYYAAVIIICANAGGAWSPIGDITTIMLWIGGQVTTLGVIKVVFLPSVVSVLIPILWLTHKIKQLNKLEGVAKLEKLDFNVEHRKYISDKAMRIVFWSGIIGLLFVPVFKITTGLPPFMGILISMSVVWVIVERIHNKHKNPEYYRRFLPTYALQKIDFQTMLFFIGILMAVFALQVSGHLDVLANKLDSIPLADGQKLYVVGALIGMISSVIDNVPLVAAAMKMYDVSPDPTSAYAAGGLFWDYLAYCAGTGGSLLLIGSAAGIAMMGIEKIPFFWYVKNITFIAFLGYIAGTLTFVFLKYLGMI